MEFTSTVVPLNGIMLPFRIFECSHFDEVFTTLEIRPLVQLALEERLMYTCMSHW